MLRLDRDPPSAGAQDVVDVAALELDVVDRPSAAGSCRPPQFLRGERLRLRGVAEVGGAVHDVQGVVDERNHRAASDPREEPPRLRGPLGGGPGGGEEGDAGGGERDTPPVLPQEPKPFRPALCAQPRPRPSHARGVGPSRLELKQ